MVKYHLKRTLSEIHLNFEQCYALIVQIVAILNSIPHCPLSADPDDHSVITRVIFCEKKSKRNA